MKQIFYIGLLLCLLSQVALASPVQCLLIREVRAGNGKAAGLRSQDCIVRYGGRRPQTPSELLRWIRLAKTPTQIDFLRDTKRMSVQVPPGPLGLLVHLKGFTKRQANTGAFHEDPKQSLVPLRLTEKRSATATPPDDPALMKLLPKGAALYARLSLASLHEFFTTHNLLNHPAVETLAWFLSDMSENKPGITADTIASLPLDLSRPIYLALMKADPKELNTFYKKLQPLLN